MPKLWKFLNRETEKPKVQNYEFASTEDLELTPDEKEKPEDPADVVQNVPEEEMPAPPAEQLGEKKEPEGNPIEFARVQAEVLIQGARSEAEKILADAREEIRIEKESARELGHQEGYEAGFQEGRQQGTVKAAEEAAAVREKQEEEFGKRIETFSRSAERALTRQLNDNLEGMKELALAVAEKVVCVSLRSSSEVIGKMIQTAVDKQKRREWVHIYISQGDAKKLTRMPPALAAALAELSDHVRIIPMADDEQGTCIVEFPDQIIDASASTQIQNIRELLSSQYGKQ